MSNIYLPIGRNPWGFKFNINDPHINELYRRYKAWKGLATNLPITDNQRREFESYLEEMLRRKNNPPLI